MEVERGRTGAASMIIRPARAADLPLIYDIFYTIEVGDDPDVPPRPAMLPDYPHLLANGELYVAEGAGEILGFVGLVVRSNLVFITDLFVREDRQSGRIGTRLLRHALAAHAGLTFFTVSSSDPRALSLYIRAGMRPQWPNLLLRGHTSSLRGPLARHVSARPATPGDPALVEWDTMLCGRERPEDHAYWVREEGGVPLWLFRGGEAVGYAYVRLRAGTFYYPDAVRIGPVGVRSPADAADCVAAAVRWAAEQARVLRIDVPGSHPALAPLLEAGFRITYVETLVAATDQLFFDPARYLGSGGSLF